MTTLIDPESSGYQCHKRQTKRDTTLVHFKYFSSLFLFVFIRFYLVLICGYLFQIRVIYSHEDNLYRRSQVGRTENVKV